MRRAALCIAAFGLAVLSSCSQGNIYGILGRPAADPLPETPVVALFKEEARIGVSWSADPAADLFILTVAKGNPAATRTELYRGTAVSYQYDSSGDVDDTALYFRLAKVRGSNEFASSSPAFAIARRSVDDAFEPNTTSATASPHLSTTNANTYCYYSPGTGELLMDPDWYSVALGPKQTLVLHFAAEGGDSAADLLVSIDGEVPKPIVFGDTYNIVNMTDQAAVKRFEVLPNQAFFCNMGSPSPTGKVRAYSIVSDRVVFN